MITLEFTRDGNDSVRSMSVTIPIENATHLAAGVINALRTFEQQSSGQMPRLRLNEGQSVSINALPVDRWMVTRSEQFSGRALLHLLAAGGLYLTYSFGTDVTRFVGESLAATAQAAPNSAPPGTQQ